MENGKLSCNEVSTGLCKAMNKVYMSLVLNHEKYNRNSYLTPKAFEITLLMIKIFTDSIFGRLV